MLRYYFDGREPIYFGFSFVYSTFESDHNGEIFPTSPQWLLWDMYFGCNNRKRFLSTPYYHNWIHPRNLPNLHDWRYLG